MYRLCKLPSHFGVVFFFFIVLVVVENGRALEDGSHGKAAEVGGDVGAKSAARVPRNAVPPSGLPPTRFTLDEIHQIVGVHNNLRSSVTPGAANMQYMKWHDELAGMSQAWADKCVFEHGQVEVESLPYGQIGQNLWKGSPRMSRSPQPTQDWYNEVFDYEFETLTCNPGKECGHYTQVVWAETNRVGCGVMECDGFAIVVCNYGPIGNHQGVPPYKVGTACTKCASGAGWCDHGLCVDCQDGDCECPLVCQNCGDIDRETCTCSCKDGWDGLDCADLCNNTYAGCYQNPGYPQAACSRLAMLQTGCREMCGYCAFASEDSGNTCCGGKICHNGGVLDTANDCTCTCMGGYHGENCEQEDVVESLAEMTVPRSTSVSTNGNLMLSLLISLMKIVAL